MNRLKVYEPKTECFAYSREKKCCKALSTLICANKDKCPFYKHKSEVDFKEIERAVTKYSGITTNNKK